jgi:hypothetical protein
LLATLLLPTVGCGGGGGSSGDGGVTTGVQPGNAQLLTIGYGRLVDVLGLVNDARGQTVQLFLKDVVIVRKSSMSARAEARCPTTRSPMTF